jgi:hypothetical protein
MRALCVILSLAVAPTAFAQSPTSTTPASLEPPVEVRYQRRTIIDITEVTIEGVVVGPTTTAVRGARRPAFKALISLRPDFRKELAATPDAL